MELKQIKEIIILSKQYGYTFKLYPESAYLKSENDEWVIEPNEQYIVLNHINKNKRKIKSHMQRKYQDFEFMFESIKNHDKFLSDSIVSDAHMQVLFSQIAN